MTKIGLHAAAATFALGGALALAGTAHADGVHHAINVCQSATIYYGSNPGINGTANNANYTIGYGNKVGWQTSAPVYNGWANVQDYGPQTWGWMRQECIGGVDSW